MNTRVSIVIPVAENWLPYLERTVRSIALQDCHMDKIEVIISVDGGDSDGSIASTIQPQNLPFACQIIDSPRPHGADVPHRNHARNAGCRAARGDILWVLDSDQLLEDGCVNSLIEAYDDCCESGHAPVILFPMYSLSASPSEWLSDTAGMLGGRETLASLWGRIYVSQGAWDGFAGLYRDNYSCRKSVAVGNYKENMPAFPRFLWDALGGFDERFLYWGGNKIEFAQRLNHLSRAGWLTTRLITNRRIIHQPHPQDPMRTRFDLAPIHKNQKMFNKIIEDLSNEAPWCIQMAGRVSKEILKHNLTPRIHYDIIAHNPCSEFIREAHRVSQGEPLHFVFTGKLSKRMPGHDLWVDMVSAPEDNPVLGAHLGMSFCNGKRVAILDLSQKPSLNDVVSALKVNKGNPHVDINSGISIFVPRAYHKSGGLRFSSFRSLSHAVTDLGLTMRNEDPRERAIASLPHYKPRVPLWVAAGVSELRDRPRISLGIITYNRRDFLQKCVESLVSSLRPSLFEYDIVISDDASTDSTREYLSSIDIPEISVMANEHRVGVAGQTNRILQRFNGSVEYGFVANDDLIFLPGWEELYSYAMSRTGYAHFAFTDLELEKRVNPVISPPHEIIDINGVRLVNWRRMRLQGGFMSFDQRVIDKVGGMDSKRFGVFGHEHVDWTVRIRRAGLAPGGIEWTNGVFDVLGSTNTISLNLNDYKRSISMKDISIKTEHEFNKVAGDQRRIYIPIDNGIEKESCDG